MLDNTATDESSTPYLVRSAHGNLLLRHALLLAFWASGSSVAERRDKPTGGAGTKADAADAGPAEASEDLAY